MNKLIIAAIAATTLCGITACDRGPGAGGEKASGEQAPVAQQKESAGFQKIEAPASTQVKSSCALDKIDGKLAKGKAIAAKTGSAPRFNGWIADPQRGVPAAFQVVLSGAQSYGANATASLPRADVARALHLPTLQNAGFDTALKLDGVAPGTYAISLVYGAPDSAIVCRTTSRLSVTN